MIFQEKRIDELGRVVTGKTPATKNPEFYDGEYLFVTPTDLDWQSFCVRETNSTVTELAKEKHKNQFIPADATMVTCIGNTMGKTGISSDECLTNQQINSIIPNEDTDPQFLYYLLVSKKEAVRGAGMGGGAAQPIINKTVFSSLKFKVPEKITQSAIGRVLKPYDDLNENNRRRIALLEEAARLLYREWFVHFRFPGHEHVKIVDGAPEGWRNLTFDDVCEAVGGGTPSTKVPEYWDNGNVTWITPTDITRNSCLALLDGEKSITELGLKKSSAKMVPANTILMTSRASIGFFGLIDREVCTNQGFINVIPNDPNHRMYLLFNLLSRVEEIRGHAGGSTYAEISKSKFKALPVVVPVDHLVEEFEQRAWEIISQVRVLHTQNSKLAEARDLLLPRLMDGRIEV